MLLAIGGNPDWQDRPLSGVAFFARRVNITGDLRMDIITQIKGLANLGMRIVVGSMQYTLRREKLEKKFAPKGPRKAFRVGAFVAAEPAGSGMNFRFENAELEVLFVLPGVPRLTWTPGELPLNCVVARAEFNPVQVATSEVADGFRLESNGLVVTVAKSGAVEFRTAAGMLLRTDAAPVMTESGWKTHASMQDDEQFFGMGMKASPFSVRGCTFSLWNMEPRGAYAPGDDPLYVSAPTYLSVSPHGSYLAFYDNTFKSTFSFDGALESQFTGGAVRYYMFAGAPEDNVARYYGVIGHPVMPPRWALGYHQCRWSYMNEGEVREIADGFKSRDLPLSAIHMDIHYMDGYRVFTVDDKRFPDLKGLADDLMKDGVRLVTILDPGVKTDPGYFLYSEGREKDIFMKLPDGGEVHAVVWPCWCAFPDFSDPVARDWWANQYKILLDKGISGFWHDMNEPAAFAAWGGCTLPTVAVQKLEGRGGTHLEAHNLYGLQEAMAGFDGQRRFRPERRPWILSRSGWPGLSRYAWHWTGDSESNWWSLEQTLRILMNMSVSGIPYTGADIGGFGGTPDKELYVRWFEAAAMMPFFRVHSAYFTPRREPWCYDDETLEITRFHLKRRYSLMSYWYTLAAAATRTGRTPVRPMYMEDLSMVDVDDQFMVGAALMMAPIVKQGVTTRGVRFPSGTWYDWETGDALAGGKTIDVPAPLGAMPMFAKAGSVVPVDVGDAVELRVFMPMEDGRGAGGELYRDAGDGFGPWLLEQFQVVAEGGVVTVTRKATGEFVPGSGTLLLAVVGSYDFAKVMVDGVAVATSSGPAEIPAGFNTIQITA